MNTIRANLYQPTYNLKNYAKKNNNIAFKGALGNELVNIAKKETLNTGVILEKAKGVLGLSKEKVGDIFESFSRTVTDQQAEIRAKNENIDVLNLQVREFPKKLTKEIEDVTYKLRSGFEKTINALKKEHVEEIAKKDAEIQKLSKFADMVKVKSIEELDVVMPDKAINTIKGMIENTAISAESMGNFLFTGKGQEAAVEQLNKAMVVNKANVDQITHIPVVEKEYYELKKYLYNPEDPISAGLTMVKNALFFHPQASAILSPKVEAQVEQNAISILRQLYPEKNIATGQKNNKLENELASIFKSARNFHSNYQYRLERYKKYHSADLECIEKIVPYNLAESKVYVQGKNGIVMKSVNLEAIANGII